MMNDESSMLNAGAQIPNPKVPPAFPDPRNPPAIARIPGNSPRSSCSTAGSLCRRRSLSGG
jgi:hypothetical protein